MRVRVEDLLVQVHQLLDGGFADLLRLSLGLGKGLAVFQRSLQACGSGVGGDVPVAADLDTVS
jgi:hypothetical protein